MSPSLSLVFSRARRPSPPLPADCRKWDLIHALADMHGYRSLLEISTAGTAGSYASIDQSRFSVCRRLSYLTPDDWTDGAAIDYRSRDRDTAACLRQIRAEGLTFDMVFVDAWHEYETARRDMSDALGLVNRRGVILAHDCLPNRADLSVPLRGDLVEWYGVSYKVYVDTLVSRTDLRYCTVDTDCGCGMIVSGRRSPTYRSSADLDSAIVRAWRAALDDHIEAYRLYEIHRNVLMNVVSVPAFLDAERQRAAWRVGDFLPRWGRQLSGGLGS